MAYTKKIKASVERPIFKAQSAQDKCKIFAIAPMITTAAPTHTTTLTRRFTVGETPEAIMFAI
jgi:hypothetical protein